MKKQSVPNYEVGCPLELVIATGDLNRRPRRDSDEEKERRITLNLLKELAKSPECFFQKLVHAAQELTGADSTGISLLDEEGERFVWPAVAGPLDTYLWRGTPMSFGPCGTVLESNAAVLFAHPERHFKYLIPIQPPLVEVLLVPFHLNGKPVGTIWAVIHEKGRQFDGEDRNLLQNLSQFAASAYATLEKARAIKPMLQKGL